MHLSTHKGNQLFFFFLLIMTTKVSDPFKYQFEKALQKLDFHKTDPIGFVLFNEKVCVKTSRQFFSD